MSSLPPGPYSYEATAMPATPDGTGHVYLCDKTGRKIASIWGPAESQVALANFIIAAQCDTLPADREVLDAQMQAVGMISLTALLEEDSPLDRRNAHAAVLSLDAFEWYLKMRYEKFLLPRIKQQLARAEDSEMTEWYLSHASAYHDILVNYRKAKKHTTDLRVEQLKGVLECVMDDLKYDPAHEGTITMIADVLCKDMPVTEGETP